MTEMTQTYLFSFTDDVIFREVIVEMTEHYIILLSLLREACINGRVKIEFAIFRCSFQQYIIFN